MCQDNITIIKRRSRTIQKVVKAIYIIVGTIFFLALIVSVFLFFEQPDKFNAVKGNLDWFIAYKVTNGSSFGIYIPFKIIQSFDSNMFVAKYAFVTYLLSISLIKTPLILYGVYEIKNILNSTINDSTPFIKNNVIRLRKIAYIIIIYSVIADILSSLLCTIFVTKILYLDLSNIDLNGVLIGGLVFIIADIFKYGVFLQNESDTTL